MLILGMEQRLQAREEKLEQCVERADSEGRKFIEGRRVLMELQAPLAALA